MEHELRIDPRPAVSRESTSPATILRQEPAYQAFRMLQAGFIAAPILAGADKFFHLLTNWDQYLTPLVPRITHIPAHPFMMIVGVIEIVAGIGVALKPRWFGYVVSAWLAGIILNLLLLPGYYDVALRDLGLSIGALALARLATRYESGRPGTQLR
ncbi:MAG: hypothetical protein JO332_19815 [Planctomycetaceae bacterium]|nr:hypothetical protein [Planctomycetaceae bacterium]